MNPTEAIATNVRAVIKKQIGGGKQKSRGRQMARSISAGCNNFGINRTSVPSRKEKSDRCNEGGRGGQKTRVNKVEYVAAV